MSSTDPVNPNNRFSRYTGRPPQSPMGPRLRAQRSTPSSPEHNPRHSTSTHLTLNLLDPPSLIIERSTSTPPPEIPPQTTKVAPKRPMLTPPPTLDFDTVPVQWKGLPLEAALWTFDSRELQRLVSRAIRLTARESFIRLLSLENLERVLPTEIERLRGLKLSTQSRYRFLVHRRTMLLQALNSSADSATNSSSPNNSSNTKNNNVVSQLAVQLAQTTAECDRVLEELLRIDDQLAQIERMMDMHWTSALAIALRKLNKSYAQRSSELLEARNRIEQLEAELDDAWNEAERIAKEMDNYTMNDFDVEEAVILKAERISGTNSPTFGALLQVKPLPVFTPLSPMAVPQFLQTPNEEDNNVDYPPPTQQPQTQPRSQHQHQHQHQNPTKDTVDTSSIRSGKSTRSTKSMRSAKSAKNPDTFHLSLVTAARKRSHRTSKGSLRLPRTPTRSRSHSRTGTTHSHDQSQAHNEEEHPPVPDIPIEFSLDSSLPSASPKPSSNIVWPGSSTHSQISFGTQFHSHSRTHSRMVSTSSRRYRRTSADDIISLRTTQMREMEKGRRDSSSSYAPTVTLDDINVPPPSYHGHDEIQFTVFPEGGYPNPWRIRGRG
ncbi:hypothetical protein L208DRAFT_1388134 [Tricholoma matsutake]|nr:hypothetical protein L208DRAFT_1388134 [Tricholoma matsutake 945]